MHLGFLIAQLSFIALYFLCKVFEWPGASANAHVSWVIPAGFYLVLSVVELFRRQFRKALVYFLFVWLFAFIFLAFSFSFYNSILHSMLCIGFCIAFAYKQGYRRFNQAFKVFVGLMLAINLLLLILSNEFILRHGYSSDHIKSYADNELGWDYFTKTDSLKDGYDANIEAFIFCRLNRTHNYTSGVAVAKMETDSSYYTTQDPGLLRHEYYHFKITELVTRRLNEAFEKHHFSGTDVTQDIFYQYLDTLYAMQHSYDSETAHNLNSEKQKEWQLRIDKELGR